MELTLEQCRSFLKDTVRLTVDFSATDQSRGKAAPPIQKPVPPGGTLIDLTSAHDWKGIGNVE